MYVDFKLLARSVSTPLTGSFTIISFPLASKYMTTNKSVQIFVVGWFAFIRVSVLAWIWKFGPSERHRYMYTVDDVPLVEELPLFLSVPIQHCVDSFTFVRSGKSILVYIAVVKQSKIFVSKYIPTHK